MGDNICKTFFLIKKSDNFPFDMGQMIIVRQPYERWAPILGCGDFDFFSWIFLALHISS